jgi:hypothetical protein
MRLFETRAHLEPVARQCAGHDRDDAAGIDNHRVPGQRAGRLDRHHPRGIDPEVAGLHARSVTEKKAPTQTGALFGNLRPAEKKPPTQTGAFFGNLRPAEKKPPLKRELFSATFDRPKKSPAEAGPFSRSEVVIS